MGKGKIFKLKTNEVPINWNGSQDFYCWPINGLFYPSTSRRCVPDYNLMNPTFFGCKVGEHWCYSQLHNGRRSRKIETKCLLTWWIAQNTRMLHVTDHPHGPLHGPASIIYDECRQYSGYEVCNTCWNAEVKLPKSFQKNL